MSANNLQNEIQLEFVINAIKEIRNNNKRPNNQIIFDHVTKMAPTNMDHSQIDELIGSMLNNGLIYDKPSKKDTPYFIMEATNTDKEKAGDNTDVNIGNNNCFARCSNPPSPYKDIDCLTKEPEIVTDLSTPQIKKTEKPKPNYEVLENNLISLKKEIVQLKELIMGEMITVNQRIKSVEQTQSRDEVKHLREGNSSKTAIIKILSENINHHITHSSNTSNSSIQQDDFTQSPKNLNNARFRPPKKPVKPNKSKITKNDTDIVSQIVSKV